MAQPGWYTDPSDSSRLRYFDGSNWTHQTQQQQSVAPVAPAPFTPPGPPPAPPAPAADPSVSAPNAAESFSTTPLNSHSVAPSTQHTPPPQEFAPTPSPFTSQPSPYDAPPHQDFNTPPSPYDAPPQQGFAPTPSPFASQPGPHDTPPHQDFNAPPTPPQFASQPGPYDAPPQQGFAPTPPQFASQPGPYDAPPQQGFAPPGGGVPPMYGSYNTPSSGRPSKTIVIIAAAVVAVLGVVAAASFFLIGNKTPEEQIASSCSNIDIEKYESYFSQSPQSVEEIRDFFVEFVQVLDDTSGLRSALLQLPAYKEYLKDNGLTVEDVSDIPKKLNKVIENIDNGSIVDVADVQDALIQELGAAGEDAITALYPTEVLDAYPECEDFLFLL